MRLGQPDPKGVLAAHKNMVLANKNKLNLKFFRTKIKLKRDKVLKFIKGNSTGKL